MGKVLGIIGAGKLGTVIGRAASDAGWQVLMYDAAPVVAAPPQAKLVSLSELVNQADIVMLAVPFGASAGLDYSLLDGKIVLDPMNYWEPVDGVVAAMQDWAGATSELIAARNPKMRLAKSLNHLSYHDFTSDARSAEVTDRRAIAVAADDLEAQRLVSLLVDDIGFEPVPVPLDRAKLLEPDGPVFGRWLTAAELRTSLGINPVQ